jgi:thiosulfate reductase cytochrome b subunit
VLVWFPILAPILLSLVRIFSGGRFRFDYLMPAELFPLAMLGGGLLAWAALRAHSHQKLIIWGLGAAALCLVISQGLAVATGLASGATETGGWQWVLMLAFLAMYSTALIVVAIGGLLLLGDVFQPPDSSVESPQDRES